MKAKSGSMTARGENLALPQQREVDLPLVAQGFTKDRLNEDLCTINQGLQLLRFRSCKKVLPCEYVCRYIYAMLVGYTRVSTNDQEAIASSRGVERRRVREKARLDYAPQVRHTPYKHQ